MPSILHDLLAALVRLPGGFLEAILRLGDAILRLLRRLKGEKKPARQPRCFTIPPDVARRPDPCIYDQWYLASKGLAVTWDNPDIQIRTPAGVPVDSATLSPDTDYIVDATIHNASFDAALGVEVICVYRPWSFGTANRDPVEADAMGNPAVRVLNIGAWSSAQAKFKWHTPDTDDAHFCIQVECRHPADREPNNNLGQENTQVVRATAASFAVPLVNLKPNRQTLTIAADRYAIPDEQHELRLTELRPSAAARPSDRPREVVSLRVLHPVHPSEGGRIRLSSPADESRRFATRSDRTRRYRVYGYEGRSELRGQNARGLAPLPDDWAVAINGTPMGGDGVEVRLEPRESQTVQVAIGFAALPPRGDRINVNAFYEDGALAGGVTIRVET